MGLDTFETASSLKGLTARPKKKKMLLSNPNTQKNRNGSIEEDSLQQGYP